MLHKTTDHVVVPTLRVRKSRDTDLAKQSSGLATDMQGKLMTEDNLLIMREGQSYRD